MLFKLCKLLKTLFATLLCGLMMIPVKAEAEEPRSVGDNFFDYVDGPIKFEYWGRVEGFAEQLLIVDRAGHLLPENQTVQDDVPLLWLFLLEDWKDVENIPDRYAIFGDFLSNISPNETNTLKFFEIDYTHVDGTELPMRVYLISLARLPKPFQSLRCRAEFIYATALFGVEAQDAQLSKTGCRQNTSP